jgi:aldoxime dehydratase
MVARYKPQVKGVVMAYFGLQYRSASARARADERLNRLGRAFEMATGPRHWDRAVYIDEANFDNVISIGYWDVPEDFAEWFENYGASWTDGSVADRTVGTFVEVLQPAIERFETLFSSTAPEGVACLADGFSDAVQEHAYWGGARDRIPLSQVHDLAPVGGPRVVTDGLRQTVTPYENLCLIRSGQDWSATEAEERRMYLEDVEPALHAGMEFLRDDGLAIGCFANRYMTVLDSSGRAMQKTFGMSWWKSLEALERWAESHPTHLAIFGAAMKYLSTLGPAAKLKLYHEVTVVAAHEQKFEYFNCHPRTGMLRAGALAASSGR